MNVPIKFPSQIEVIDEEVARFRGLSAEDRLQSIRGLLAAGSLMMQRSPRSAFLHEHTLEQENAAANAIKEFLARHVH